MKIYFLRCYALMLLTVLWGCSGSAETAKPVSDRIRQIWTVNVAYENGVIVYTKNGTGNVKPGYAQFRLDLSDTQQKTVRLTEIDNTTFAGTWALSADDTRLILSGLSPQPTGNSTIEYVINGDVSETVLNLTRSTQNPKTGSTISRYELMK